MSLMFLTDTIALIQHITVNIQSGKTYIQMFEDIGYGFYRKLSFENINGFVSSLKCNGLVYKEYIYLAEKFLLSAGRHPMEEELLYLNNNLETVKKSKKAEPFLTNGGEGDIIEPLLNFCIQGGSYGKNHFPLSL